MTKNKNCPLRFDQKKLLQILLEVEGSLPLSGLPVPPLLWLLEGPPIPICVPKLMPNPIALELF